MNTVVLLPCPFCGKEPTIKAVGMRQMVSCENDECRVQSFIRGATAKEAAGRWNQRPSQAEAMQRVVEAAKNARHHWADIGWVAPDAARERLAHYQDGGELWEALKALEGQEEKP